MSDDGQGAAAGDVLTWDGSKRIWSPISTLAGSGVLSFSNRRISGAAGRFLEPYSGSRVLAPTLAVQILAPRAGTIRNLFVRHRVAGGSPVLITYTLRVNEVATALVASILSNSAALQTSNVVDSVVVAQGDRLDLDVTKADNIGPGPTDIFATMEFDP